jgi:hypothetical protein
VVRNPRGPLALALGIIFAACGREAPSAHGQWKYLASHWFERQSGQPSCVVSGVLTLAADGSMLHGSLLGTERCSDDYQDSVQVTASLTGAIVPFGADAWSVVLDAEDSSMHHYGYASGTDMAGRVRYAGRYGLADWEWWACKPPVGVHVASFSCPQRRLP